MLLKSFQTKYNANCIYRRDSTPRRGSVGSLNDRDGFSQRDAGAPRVRDFKRTAIYRARSYLELFSADSEGMGRWGRTFGNKFAVVVMRVNGENANLVRKVRGGFKVATRKIL